MTLEFKVTGQHIAWTNNTAHVVADSRNYLRAAFELSEEWTYPVTVLFKGGCKAVPVLLAQAGEEITVPPEVLKAPMMLVSCYCGDLITADSARVQIASSGYTEDTSPPVPPPPNLYQELIAYYSSYAMQKPKGDGEPWQTIGFDSNNEIAWVNPPVMDGTKTPEYQEKPLAVLLCIDISSPITGEFYFLKPKFTYIRIKNGDQILSSQYGIGTPYKVCVLRADSEYVEYIMTLMNGSSIAYTYDVQEGKYTMNQTVYPASSIDRKFDEINERIEHAGGLPSVTADDNGKFLRVVDGVWAAEAIPIAEEGRY